MTDNNDLWNLDRQDYVALVTELRADLAEARADMQRFEAQLAASNCERIFTRDTLLENGGRGYLCPTCADSELARLRREIRKLRSELNKQGGQQAGE